MSDNDNIEKKEAASAN